MKNENELPEIILFQASTSVIQNKEPFSLEWKVENADTIEILKNGMPFRKPGPQETSTSVSESYDGRERQIKYLLTAVNSFGRSESLPVFVRLAKKVERSTEVPEIISFQASASQVSNREPFSLSWEVVNADRIEILRNGLHYKKPEAGSSGVNITESYDGKDRVIEYQLLASNDTAQSKSLPVAVKVSLKAVSHHPEPVVEQVFETPVIETPAVEEIAEVPVVEETAEIPAMEESVEVPTTEETTPIYGHMPTRQDRYEDHRNKNIRNIRLAITGILAVIVAALIGIFIYYQNKPKLADVDPRNVTEEHTVVIVGKNLPADSNKIQVLFNKIRGSIQYNSEEILRVIVPSFGNQLGDGIVRISVVINGDTLHVPGNLTVTKRVTLEPVPELLNDLPPTEDLVPLIVDSPHKKSRTPPKKSVRQDTVIEKVETTPVTEPVKEPKKAIDINKMVKVSSSDFKRKTFGGVKDLELTVQNNSPYDLDNVSVEINYLKKNERNIKKANIIFADVKAHTSKTKEVPNSNRGAKITFSITSINSKQLDQDMQNQ